MVHSCYHFCEAGDSLLAIGGVDGSFMLSFCEAGGSLLAIGGVDGSVKQVVHY